MSNRPLWSRRKFSKALLSLQILATTGLASTSFNCNTKQESLKKDLLDAKLVPILKLAMDDIIPQSNEMPASSEVGVYEYITVVLKENQELIPAFEQVLIRLNDQSIEFVKNDFIKLDSDSRIKVLIDFEKAEPHLFETLKLFVYEGYYINEQVWQLIGYEPYPTLSPGPKMDPFDEKLLNRMKQIPPFYTKI